jgi:hypothetical protein
MVGLAGEGEPWTVMGIAIQMQRRVLGLLSWRFGICYLLVESSVSAR